MLDKIFFIGWIGVLTASIYSKDKAYLKVYAITGAIMGLCYYGEKIWS